MRMRQIVEKELLEQHSFGLYARELYRSGMWNHLFEPRTVNAFQALLTTGNVPQDDIAQEIFQNNISPQAPEDLLFRNGFDLQVLGTMRYNLGCIHSHSYFEMYYLARGSCSQQINGAYVDMQEGDFIILAPDSSHHIQILDDDTIVLTIALRKSTFQRTFFGLFQEADTMSAFFTRVLNNQSAEFLPVLDNFDRAIAQEAAQKIPTLMYIAEHWADVAEPWYNALCPETPTYVMGGHLMAAQYPDEFNARLEQFLQTGK